VIQPLFAAVFSAETSPQ